MWSRGIVIDSGSYEIKSGFSGDGSPTSIIKTTQPRSSLIQTYDLDWETMENAWFNTFYNELRVNPEDGPVFLTDLRQYPSYAHPKIAQIMFETFSVRGLAIENSNLLSLCSSYADFPASTGIVVDFGYNSVTITPIYEFKVLENSIIHVSLGGNQIKEHLREILWGQGHWFKQCKKDNEIIENLKIEYSFLSSNRLSFDENDTFDPQNLIKRPWVKSKININDRGTNDDNKNTIQNIQKAQTEQKCENILQNDDTDDVNIFDSSVFAKGMHTFMKCAQSFSRASEILFSPKLFHLTYEQVPIHKAIYNSVQSVKRLSPNISEEELWKNVILCGKGAKLVGLQNRLRSELLALLSPEFDLNVRIPLEPEISSWIGGSVYSYLFEEKGWEEYGGGKTIEMYNEIGPSVMLRK